MRFLFCVRFSYKYKAKKSQTEWTFFIKTYTFVICILWKKYYIMLKIFDIMEFLWQ